MNTGVEGPPDRRPRWCLLPQGGLSSGDAPPVVVVAKSAKLRFRLRRKLRPLPCSSSPHRAGRGEGPIFGLAKRETGRARSKEKSVRRAPVQWPSARDGGRRIGACSDLGWPSGTLFSSAKSALPSRGGWCPDRRGARTHLTSSSFRAFRFATRCPGGRRNCCLALC